MNASQIYTHNFTSISSYVISFEYNLKKIQQVMTGYPSHHPFPTMALDGMNKKQASELGRGTQKNPSWKAPFGDDQRWLPSGNLLQFAIENGHWYPLIVIKNGVFFLHSYVSFEYIFSVIFQWSWNHRMITEISLWVFAI